MIWLATKYLDNGEEVAYGFDHAIGYFFCKFAAEPDEEGEDVMLIEESSLFSKLTKTRMMELLIEYKCSDVHMQYVAMDQPIP